MNDNYYEALWYSNKNNDKTNICEFSSKKALHKFYEKHKNDYNKCNWKLTYRTKYREVIKDIKLDDTSYDENEEYDKYDDGRYTYNIFGNENVGEFYDIDDVIKIIEMAQKELII